MRFLILMFLLASPVLASDCTPPSDPEFSCGSREFQGCSLNVNGLERLYCQHIPRQGGDLPFVFAFHGAGGKSKAMVNLLRSQTEQSMVLIAPQALSTRHMGECTYRWRQIGDTYPDWLSLTRQDDCAGGTGIDDLAFTEALLDHFTPKQAFATGFSNGADFLFQIYMTLPIASRFNGYATAGAGLKGQKAEALQGGGAGRYYVNNKVRRPFLMQIGTADKKNLDIQALAAAVDNHPGCKNLRSAKDVFQCLINVPVLGKDRPFDMSTRRSATRDWLVEFNGSDPDARESLYPNLGKGPEPDDRTMTVREDHFEQGEGTAAVAILTTIDGGHDWPGWGGNRAPCPRQNCDIDLMAEIIQFWRAHAGMKLPLP